VDSRLRVVLVEDEDLYRDLLRGVLEHEPELHMVGSFGDGASALAVAPALRPDVALLDIELGRGPSGIQVGLELRRRLPELGIVVLSQHADPRFVAALQRHASRGWAYLLKTSVRERTVIVRALRGAARGEVVLDPQVVAGGKPRPGGRLGRLTPRQREILQLVAQGLTNAAIAERLVLAEKSVENQLTTVYEHLGIDRRDGAVHARVQAVLAYLRESRWDLDTHMGASRNTGKLGGPAGRLCC
jgi:DNA-binding NarL/FixJ family response regulator